MAKHPFPVFDGDGHVLENDDELLEHYEGRFQNIRMQRTYGIFPSLDGWSRGVINSTEDANRKYVHTDAHVWREMVDVIGIEGTVLYPTAGLACGLISDVEWAVATATAYNNWLEARYTSRDERFFGAGMLAVQDPDAAAAEIARCKTERVRFPACVLPSMTILGKTYGDDFFSPIFEAAEKHNMPLAIHGAPSRGLGFDHFTEFVKVHTLEHPFPLMIHLTDIVFSGVFDRYPGLRIAFLEGGCTWVPFMMDRMDYEYDSIFGATARNRLSKRPSDYIREGDNFWVAMELGERGLKYAIDAMGSERILYASDYPHEPTEEDLTTELPEFIASNDYSEAVKKNLLYNNMINFYQLA